MQILLAITLLSMALGLAAGLYSAPPPRASALSANLTASPAPKARPGDFVWHDLVTDDPAASRAFYGAAFGWTFAPGDGVDPGYTLITHEDRVIGGIVARRGERQQRGGGQWLSYMVVDDVDRAAAAFAVDGGRIIRGPLDARKDLRVAAVADGQGAVLGLASRGPRFSTRTASGRHDWLWMEYVARDPERGLRFYSDLVGYRYEIAEQRVEFTYYLFSTDRPRAGLFRTLWHESPSVWLPYIRVEDPAAAAAQVVRAGGSIVLAPQSRVRNNSLALVLDPSGAALALQKFPFEGGAHP